MLKKTIILSMLLQGAVQAGVLIPEQIKAPVGYKPVLTVHVRILINLNSDSGRT